jgi:starch synthase
VVNGETGVLLEAGDVERLARELGRLLADRPEAERLGEAGLARARSEFSVDHMVQQTIDVYRGG